MIDFVAGLSSRERASSAPDGPTGSTRSYIVTRPNSSVVRSPVAVELVSEPIARYEPCRRLRYQVGKLRHLEPPLRGHGGEARWHDHIGEPTGVRLSELVPGEPQHFTMAIFTSGLLPFGERRFVTVSGVDLVFEDARDRIQTLPLR